MSDSTGQLQAQAAEAARTVTIAELHGAACGLASIDLELLSVEELVELLGADAVTDSGTVEVFIQSTVSALTADDMSFAPLLLSEEPSEFDASAGEAMATALAGWASAYLAGVAVGLARRRLEDEDNEVAELTEVAEPTSVVDYLQDLPGEASEIVHDFIAIAQLDTDVELSDDSERAFAELEEYIKVGVLLLANLLMRTG